MSTPVDNALMLRDQFLHEERWMKNSDLPRDLATQDLLSADFRGHQVFPAFQFLAGVPHPRIRELVALLPRDGRGWPAVLWCFAPTKRLGGSRPADVFATDTDAAIDCARRAFHGDDHDW